MAPTHLIILTPSLGRVSLGYRDTFARVMLECARRDVKLSVSDATDPGQLVHARNVLLAAAVDSDATHALWWDADIAFEPAAIFDLLERPEAMVCRPYPMRAVDWNAAADYMIDGVGGPALEGPSEGLRKAAQRWTTILEYENGKPIWSKDGVLVAVGHCGFGWVLHRVDALRQFVRTEADIIEKDWRGRRVARGFDLFANENGVTVGEDIAFCQRWLEWRGDLLVSRSIWAAPDRPVQNGDHGGRFADYLEAHGLARKG